MKQKHFAGYTALGTAVFLLIAMLIFPHETSAGASRGIVLCGTVVIPSLFPYTVCVLFLMKTGVTDLFLLLDGFSRKVFRQRGDEHGVMLFSMIGGYPIGARLIDELVRQNRMTPKEARRLQCCCVNAGPGFVVLAIGEGMLHSVTLGWMLLISHLLPTFLLAFFLGRIKPSPKTAAVPEKHILQSVPDAFVSATADGAAAVFSVCTYVVLFSAAVPVLTAVFGDTAVSRQLLPLIEITSGIATSKNVFAIAFLLGFAGFSIWFQIRSVSVNYGMCFPLFLIARLIHGILSVLILRLMFFLFHPTVPTVGNGISIQAYQSISGIAVSVSLLLMTVLFLISVFYEKKGRKIREELI